MKLYSNPKYDRCQFFDQKKGSEARVNEELAQELHKLVMQKFKNFKDNVCTADLAETGSLSSKNWGVQYFLCAINVFTKFAWIKPLNDK